MTPSPIRPPDGVKSEVLDHQLDAGLWLGALRTAADAVAAPATLTSAAGPVIAEVCAAAGWPVGRLLLVAGGTAFPTDVWCLGDSDRYRSLPGTGDSGAGSARLAERAVALREPVWTGDLAEVGRVSAEASRTGLCGAVAFPVCADGG